MHRKHHNTGYSLIEVLVAISILMLSIVGPLTIAVKSLQSAQYARQQNTAFFLAQEGITALNTLRNNANVVFFNGDSTNPWAWVDDAALAPCLASAGCNIDFRDASLLDNIVNCGAAVSAGTPLSCTMRFDESAGRAVYRLAGTGEWSQFRRVITMQKLNANEVRVTSRVEWNSTLLGGAQSVSLTTSLFNTYR